MSEQPRVLKRYEAVVSSHVNSGTGDWHVSAQVARSVAMNHFQREEFEKRGLDHRRETYDEHPPPRAFVIAPHGETYEKPMKAYELRALGAQLIAAADLLDELVAKSERGEGRGDG